MRKYLLYLLTNVFILVSIYSCSNDTASKNDLKTTGNNDNWVKVKIEEKNCEIELPFDNYKQVNQVYLYEVVGKVNSYGITLNSTNTTDPNDGYKFNCFEYPEFNFYENDSIIDLFFEGITQNILDGYNAELITEEIINYKGYPGREWYFSINKGKLYGFSRSFIINNKQYSLEVFTRNEKWLNHSIRKYLESFKLLKE